MDRLNSLDRNNFAYSDYTDKLRNNQKKQPKSGRRTTSSNNIAMNEMKIALKKEGMGDFIDLMA